MTTPDLKNYTDERLADWHLFVSRQSRDFVTVTQSGRVQYRRELRRVECELAHRMEIA